MSQVVPTGPGWWWAEVTLGPDLPLDPGGVEVVAFRIYEHGGRLYALTPGHRWAGDSGVSGEPVDVTPSILKDSSYSRRWLAPVASVEEVERLRAVALAAADWLDEESAKPQGCGRGSCDEAYRVWHESQVAIAPALGLAEPLCDHVTATLRTLGGAK